MARLDLDSATAIPATRERSGHIGNRTTQDQDRWQIQRRRPNPGAGDHDEGGQGVGSGKHPQPLDLHLTHRHDWRNDLLHGHPLLLLADLFLKGPGPITIPSGTLGTHRVQHEGRSHPQMKPGRRHCFLFCTVRFK
jgi:hypothetical protein